VVLFRSIELVCDWSAERVIDIEEVNVTLLETLVDEDALIGSVDVCDVENEIDVDRERVSVWDGETLSVADRVAVLVSDLLLVDVKLLDRLLVGLGDAVSVLVFGTEDDFVFVWDQLAERDNVHDRNAVNEVVDETVALEVREVLGNSVSDCDFVAVRESLRLDVFVRDLLKDSDKDEVGAVVRDNESLADGE